MMHNKTSILLVRHGETEWNRQNRVQGNLDSPLTGLGKDQANQLRQMLERVHIEQAYVSPLKRARDTLDIIIQDRPIEVGIVDDLREIKLGPWEGKTRAETALSNPAEENNFWHQPESFALPGAETFQQLQTRMVAALESIFLRASGHTVLVVSHWIAIKVALAYYKGIPLSGLSGISNPLNGSFIRLTRLGDDAYRVDEAHS
jgi:probable phosphoglycerate mutase